MAPKLFGEKPVDGAYWTLAVEWVFYLGMALLCALGLTRREQLTRSEERRVGKECCR